MRLLSKSLYCVIRLPKSYPESAHALLRDLQRLFLQYRFDALHLSEIASTFIPTKDTSPVTGLEQLLTALRYEQIPINIYFATPLSTS